MYENTVVATLKDGRWNGEKNTKKEKKTRNNEEERRYIDRKMKGRCEQGVR